MLSTKLLFIKVKLIMLMLRKDLIFNWTQNFLQELHGFIDSFLLQQVDCFRIT